MYITAFVRPNAFRPEPLISEGAGEEEQGGCGVSDGARGAACVSVAAWEHAQGRRL